MELKTWVYQRDRHWNVLTPPTPTPRQEIYLSLCSLLRPLPTEERQSILQKIIPWAEQETIGRKTHRALTVAELKQLAQGGLVEIGAHSMTHPVLATLSHPQQLAEIEQSKIYLESILEQPVTSFAYPYSTQSDCNLETVTTVEKLGFNCTCANFPDVIWQKSDRFQLPRCLVRNWTQEQFFHRLGQYFNGGC